MPDQLANDRSGKDKSATDRIAHGLRAAVLAADHAKAMQLSTEYVEAVSQSWMALSSAERRTSQLPKQSLELLGWVREMTIMQRAMAGEQLRIAARASRYQTARAQYLQSAALATR